MPQLPGRSPLATEVNRILRTAMAKNPADRYATAAQLRDDLRRATNLPSESAPGAGGRSRRTTVIAVAFLATALVLAAIVWGLSSDDDPVARTTRPAASATPDPTMDPTETPPPSADAARAEDNLAAALLAQGLLTEEQSVCTAREWIDNAGLDTMIAEGFFDEDLAFVDRPSAEMSAEMRSAATAATVTCATS